VVAADLGVAEGGTLLAAAEDRHDRGVQIDRQVCSQISRAGARRPQTREELAADGVVLPNVAPLVGPQPRPDRRRRPRRIEQFAGGSGTEHVGVVDAVATGEHRPNHREGLAPVVGAVLGQVQPLVHQPSKVDPLGQHRGRQQSRVRDQIRLGEAHRDPAQVMR